MTRCKAYRVEIDSNRQALTIEQAAGHTEAARQLQLTIDRDTKAARAIAGCQVG